MPKSGALEGVKILDISRLLPGPYSSMILADHGAEVIAVEDKRFKAENVHIESLYRNKQHVTLNLKSDQGREILYRLAADVDVVLEGFRPGVAEKLGADYVSLAKINPQLIYCSITGYGQTGPLRDEPGHDVNYLSRAGVIDLIGEPGRRPVIPGIQVADIAGGSLNAVIGILLALIARQRTGKGQQIDISMTDGALGFLTTAKFFSERMGRDLVRGDWLLSHRYACYNNYETADNRYISIGAVENRFWKKLCEHLQVPQYIPLQFDPVHRQALIDFMRDVFKQKTLDEWDAELSGLNICYSRIQNLQEVLEDPLFRERKMVFEIEGSDGVLMPAIGVPIKLSGTPGSIRTRPVAFGESTTTVLNDLGYSEEDIEAFAKADVI